MAAVQQALLHPYDDRFEQALSLTRAALSALRKGDRARGEQLLRAAVRCDPGLGAAWLWLGALQQGARRSICLRWAQLSLPDATIPSLERLTSRPPERRLPRRPTLAAVSGLAAVLIAVGGYHTAYSGKVYPGVIVLGQSVSGATPQQSTAQLSSAVAAWRDTPLVVHIGSETWRTTLGELGNFDPRQLAERAYAVGRSGDLLSRLQAQGRGLLDTLHVAPALDERSVERLLSQLAAFERQPRPASFITTPAGWEIAPDQPGLAIDRAEVRDMLVHAWRQHQWEGSPAPIVLRIQPEPLPAATTAVALQPLLSQLRAQTAEPLLLTWDGGEQSIDRASLLDIRADHPAGQPFRARVDAVRDLVRGLAERIDRPAVPSQLIREGDRVRGFVDPVPGLVLDQERTVQTIIAALERGEQPQPLSVASVAPPPGEAERLGIVAVIGEGRSEFRAYSSPDRDQNVFVGGQEFDGLLIPPGGVISAGETIGEISWAKGYRWGDMISGGEIVPSLGGGICQVSTTLFRAAFWSGLEILERHNHNWRLPWYETDAPPGMDATIALGGPDLRIRNNTGNYILIRVETDLERKTQTVRLYGTPSARQVEMVGPSWQGGAIVIGRRVTQHGQVVFEDSFASYYSQ